MHILEQYEKSRRLPEGHYGRKEAEDKLKMEYRLARECEMKWLKKLYSGGKGAQRFLSLKAADELIVYICSALGCRTAPRVKVDKLPSFVAATYDHIKRTIIYGNKLFVTVENTVHELAHFFQHQDQMSLGHGKDFVLLEDLAFQAVENWLVDKKKKQYEEELWRLGVCLNKG